MKNSTVSPWLRRAFIATMAALAATGMMQMPLARRYYITDIPGMAWAGNFFLVHKLHYALAAVLLFLLALVLTNWFRSWRDRIRLTPWGMARAAILTGIVLSGLLRVYRNLPGVTLHPDAILAIEWTHLGLVMVMGAAALLALLKKQSPYARKR
ncbi:4Fe-4S ferredoxin [Salidesulfovibrio onnuriiensis]|uniref:4Fe-4S ferredoxin n=1 Tax=Salidesulfovibrio onnuriiensis TaxID=2583823 RepID=UPI0011C77E98|nr:4Fe-4S ferredoxin [Salidesulfovibrio onnuriiensis]